MQMYASVLFISQNEEAETLSARRSQNGVVDLTTNERPNDVITVSLKKMFAKGGELEWETNMEFEW